MHDEIVQLFHFLLFVVFSLETKTLWYSCSSPSPTLCSLPFLLVFVIKCLMSKVVSFIVKILKKIPCHTSRQYFKVAHLLSCQEMLWASGLGREEPRRGGALLCSQQMVLPVLAYLSSPGWSTPCRWGSLARWVSRWSQAVGLMGCGHPSRGWQTLSLNFEGRSEVKWRADSV